VSRERYLSIIILCVCALSVSGCSSLTAEPEGRRRGGAVRPAKAAPAEQQKAGQAGYGPSVVLGKLEDTSVSESSGLVASRRNPGLYWTHNDSGGGPFLYAFDSKGRRRGVWRVSGAKSRDWEDIAAGPGPRPGTPYLYVGDTGNNNTTRDEVVVYRVEEPRVDASDAASQKSEPRQTEEAVAIRLRYPDGNHDAEALMVHPKSGDLYVVTKIGVGPAGVYKLSAPYTAASVHTLERVGEISLPSFLSGFVTGGDISPDGRRVVLCDYFGVYELGLPEKAGTAFDAVWAQPPSGIDLGSRRQGEAVCYRLDGEAVLTTSEKRPTPLTQAERRRKRQG
jgi:hypothetical protein